MPRLAWEALALCALCACGNGGGAAARGAGSQPTAAHPTATAGRFTFYGADGGMPADVWDASADEGGNAYVVAGGSILAKRRDEAAFRRFDAAAARVRRRVTNLHVNLDLDFDLDLDFGVGTLFTDESKTKTKAKSKFAIVRCYGDV